MADICVIIDFNDFIKEGNKQSDSIEKTFQQLTLIHRPITCYSYVLMILLDHYNKIPDYYINGPFCYDDSIDFMKLSEARKAVD